MFNLFRVWLIVSSLYYIDTLLSGSFTTDFEEGFTQKFIKYVVCILFSTYFIFRAKNYVVIIFISALFMVFLTYWVTYGEVNIFATVVLIVASMIGLMSFFRVYHDRSRDISRTIVLSGFIVGVFSMLELTVFSENLIGYWAATGGVRSISTLFNPNNLGLYLGVCLLMLALTGYSKQNLVIMGVPILFGFLMSGSRTAWVSFFTTFDFLSFTRGSIGALLRRVLFRNFYWLTAFIAIFVIFLPVMLQVLELDRILSENRGVDFYTADIRLQNFFAYISSLNFMSLFPDFLDERVGFIQDNLYLIVLNSTGIIGLILSIIFFMVAFRRNVYIPRIDATIWGAIIFYYLISGLSGSFLNSFPNNQLFFLALGAILIPVYLPSRNNEAAVSRQLK